MKAKPHKRLITGMARKAGAAKPPLPPVVLAPASAKPANVRKPAEAPAPAAARPPRAKARQSYGGRVTEIDLSLAGSKPGLALTDRTRRAYEALLETHGMQPWKRGRMDAGILKFLLWKGAVVHVSGGSADPNAEFRIARRR